MLLHHFNNRCVKIVTQKRRETKPDAPRARRQIFLCLDFGVVLFLHLVELHVYPEELTARQYFAFFVSLRRCSIDVYTAWMHA